MTCERSVTDFRLFNRPVKAGVNEILTHPIWATDTIELSYKENVISLEFTKLDYIQAEGNTFEVFLENFDQDWYNAGSKSQVTYANLPAGRYIFRVRSTHSNHQEARMVFIVHPPWWNTLWFKASLTLFLVVSSYLLIQRYQTRNRRTKALADQVHEKTEKITSVKESTLFSTPPEPKSLFKNQKEIDQLQQKLQEAMEIQQLYKNEKLSLPILAKEIGTTDKKLSELLNKELNTNFYEYVNLYRIKVFKERIKKGEGQYKKMISIAFDSGFYSKSTFNRIFKKHTGLTPTQFKKKVEASNKQAPEQPKSSQ